MKLCSHHKVPVVPFGGGTSLEGQTLAPRGGVSLDFSRMKRILAVNEGDQDAHVQAGVGYVELNEYLRPRGLWFPLDPGPGATVGGMCACRCSGSTAVRYGTMRENVLNLTAVLQDGTVVRTGSRARKSAAGYDLTRLLVGSEGTLAVITEATLVRVITLRCVARRCVEYACSLLVLYIHYQRLHAIPAHSTCLRLSFPSVRAAAAAARDTVNGGVAGGRCELLDDVMVAIVNATSPSMAPWPVKTTLMVELTGLSARAVEEQVALVTAVAARHGGGDAVCAADAEEARRLWQVASLRLPGLLLLHIHSLILLSGSRGVCGVCGVVWCGDRCGRSVCGPPWPRTPTRYCTHTRACSSQGCHRNAPLSL
jgi:D-lactate dehydrogenase (cytochrome)